MVNRYERIAEEMKRELSTLIANEIKDPRLPSMVSVMAVKVTKDLKFAKAYVSVFGDENEKKNAIIVLKNAAGFLRRELSRTMNLRNTPEINFILDDSIEIGIKMSKLIDDTMKGQSDKNE